MNDMYNTFWDEDFDYDYVEFNKQDKDYLMSDFKAKYSWFYGDSTSVTFDFSGYDDDTIEDILAGTVKAIFYDFRFESILEQSKLGSTAVDNKLTFDISDVDSASIFKKGVYYCSFTLLNNVNDTETIDTLSPATDNLIYVM